MMGKIGSVKVILTREFFNSLIAVLSSFVSEDADNKYGVYAHRLQKKIMRYSRKFSERSSQQVVTHFYEDEAAVLIKVLVMYAHATGTLGADVYELIGKEGRQNEKYS